MRLLLPAAAALLVAGCGGSAEPNRDDRPLLRTAERVVVFRDGSAAVVGIGARRSNESRTDCRPGLGATWDFFATRISRDGRVVRTDLIEEEGFEGCGDLVIDARAGAGGVVEATAWVSWPSDSQSDGHGPLRLTFEPDGRTGHGTDTVGLFDYGPVAYAETVLPGGGRARMWGVGYRKGLQLVIEPSGEPALHVRSPVVPLGAVLYENWLYWYSLVADEDGVYGSGPFTRGLEGPYLFPVFRHRLDGSLDRSFGSDGVVFAHPGGFEHFVTTQVVLDGSGRVLAVGGGDTGGRRVTYVMRYLRTGRLDPAFGRGGIVRLDLGRETEDTYADTRAAIAVRPDDRILVAGGIQATGSTLWLLRPDGRLDPTFGRAGKLALTPIP